jgi:CDP-glucose 4,6-dehydratase
MEGLDVNREFWQNRRVLVTGHSGFKGSWLTLWLRRLGAHVTGISLPPPITLPNLFEMADVRGQCDSRFCDIRDAGALAAHVLNARPEIVLHLAAQPLVRAGYADPLVTFDTNIMGTAHILDAIRELEQVRVAVMVTTDKVYHNREWTWPYREDDALGGRDPYSASKAASEMVISCYRDAWLMERGVAVASARAGNVIGGGDWSDDRLIPDAVRAWSASAVLRVRRPAAVRPWQHVLEPLAGYITLAEKLWHDPGLADAYNFGPHAGTAATTREVIELARRSYGGGDVEYAGEAEGPHEAGLLALETTKARAQLGVAPRWSLEEAVQRTMTWYRAVADGSDARDLCIDEIEEYEKLL